MSATDRDLAQSVSQGDAMAVDELLRRHLPGLLAYVHFHAGGKLRALESTQDLAQSACREVLADLGSQSFPTDAAFRHWLYTAAERKIIDRARYHAREKRDVGREIQMSPEDTQGLVAICADFHTPSRHASARETLERVQRAFSELPDDYREVVLMSRLMGLSHAEIGERTGRNPGAVRMLLHRALARLTRQLGTEDPDLP